MRKQFLSLSTAFGYTTLLALVPAASAQTDVRPFTFNVGGGFTAITGYNAGRLDHGGNLQLGAGFNFNRYLGIQGTFMFHQLGITGNQLRLLNQPDGNARVYTITVDPKLSFPLGERVSVYLLAGGGFMRRTVQFTQPTLAQTFVFDPWWGYFGPVLVPVNQVLGSVSSNAGAYNVGAGVNIPLPGTSLRLYTELRYVHGFTETRNTSVLPLTVGLRW